MQSLNIRAEMKSLDALFSAFDEDGGGTLDLSELRDALERVRQGAAALKHKENALRESQRPKRAKVDRLRATAAATREAFRAMRVGGGEDGMKDEAAVALESRARELQGQMAREEAEEDRLEQERRAAAEEARLAEEEAEREEVERLQKEREQREEDYWASDQLPLPAPPSCSQPAPSPHRGLPTPGLDHKTSSVRASASLGFECWIHGKSQRSPL